MNRLDFSHLRGAVLMGIRLLLAFIFIKEGIGKWPVVDGEGLTKDLPLFLVYLVILFEFLGGVFMILGLKFEELTKIGALMIAIVMIGAAYMHYFVFVESFEPKDVLYPISLMLISLVFLTEE